MGGWIVRGRHSSSFLHLLYTHRKQLAAYAHDAALYAPSSSSSAGHLVPLHIQIRQGTLIYRDMVEWDVFNPHNSPELFAQHTVADLGTSHPPTHPPAHLQRHG